MRTIGDVLWFVLAGIWLAIAYGIAGVILCITIIGIPFGRRGLPARRLRDLAVRALVVPNPERTGRGSAIANVIWFVLAGWWLCLVHIVTGVLLCLTIIAFPFGMANFKLAGLAFAPLGKLIIPADSAAR